MNALHNTTARARLLERYRAMLAPQLESDWAECDTGDAAQTAQLVELGAELQLQSLAIYETNADCFDFGIVGLPVARQVVREWLAAKLVTGSGSACPLCGKPSDPGKCPLHERCVQEEQWRDAEGDSAS